MVLAEVSYGMVFENTNCNFRANAQENECFPRGKYKDKLNPEK